ncbi:MAG: topoisomerase DNA-binding C4 zinc finger domain-containing protein [Lachnospiraceae bacterium]|nr:topoisomerase DNA-binding C4 zinc finger domain-containing protein [Lachnospiraceae bacterium]
MTRQKGKRLTLYEKDYVVFDLETTGLSPAEDEIIEISGIKVRGHQIVEEFSTLVNPGMPIPYAATMVNGITDSMVSNAPGIKEALQNFFEFIDKDLLVGHNIHTFDTNFIYDSAMRHLGRGMQNDYIDTLYMARSCLPELGHHTLIDVAAHFEIETEGAHRALNDCRMNQLCYEKLGEIWMQKHPVQASAGAAAGEKRQEAGEMLCPECGGILMPRKGKFGEFWGCMSFPLCRYTRNKK